MRADSEFDTFWERATTRAKELQLTDCTVQSIRRPPRRVDSGSSPSTSPSPKDYFRKIYFEFLKGEIIKRFDYKNFYLYLRAKQLVLKAASTGELLEDHLSETCMYFDQDFDHSRLNNQLAVIHDLICYVNPTLQDIHTAILVLGTASSLFSKVLKLLRMLYVIPATTATAERSFSSLRRVKTYLRNTTAQWLNHMMILHVPKHLTDLLDLHRVAAEFVSRNERRKHCFGAIKLSNIYWCLLHRMMI